MRLRCSVAAAVVAGVSVLPVGAAAAEPASPAPPPSIAPAQTSSTEELADMVLDALEGGSSTPTSTPVPLPQG